jgi:hypothetical protein
MDRPMAVAEGGPMVAGLGVSGPLQRTHGFAAVLIGSVKTSPSASATAESSALYIRSKLGVMLSWVARLNRLRS